MYLYVKPARYHCLIEVNLAEFINVSVKNDRPIYFKIVDHNCAKFVGLPFAQQSGPEIMHTSLIVTCLLSQAVMMSRLIGMCCAEAHYISSGQPLELHSCSCLLRPWSDDRSELMESGRPQHPPSQR